MDHIQTSEAAGTRPVHKDQVFRGILYVCVAFFMFTLMQAFNKLLTGIHHPVEVIFYRNFLCVLPCIGYIVMTRRYGALHTGMPVMMAFRVLNGTIGLTLTFAAAQVLPLSNATVLFFTATLILPVLAHFFLKEHIGLHRWLAVLFGMCGVLLVAHPSAHVTLFGVVLALGAAMAHAVTQALLRGLRTESAFTITFYFFLGGAVFPGLAMPFIATMPSAHSALILLGVAVTGGIGQFCLTRAFQLAPASLLNPFNYTGLLWATGLDMLIWQYVPGWPVFLGGGIIIASKFYILYRERISERKNPA